ncbi:cyclase family protein [Actinoplanes sp. M2I2]|uniref:cyclase family protein n=1 Tax=Actinoplanes sp. M2I2 TaxID=1734444 RepID=UPI002021245B|nr:cyclase family protein [Actinoplanes sp. M2I2]
MQQYRAELTAEVVFATGGRLQAQGLRVDVPHPDVTEAELVALLVGSLGLRDVERVEVTGVRTFAEPVIAGIPARPRLRFVELSHVISDGMTTYPGMAAPVITAHQTWEQSRPLYAEGTEFSLDRVEMLGQTGTYLDTPRHRYAGGTDLAGLPLERLADLPAVVVRTAGSGRRAVTEDDLAPLTVAGHAVLLHTGGDRGWGTPGYAVDAPYLTGEAAALLVERGAALVGIDSVNIDDPVPGGERPAHTVLLAAGIPIVEHLTGLGEVPPHGARFTAAPPRITAFGTFPVRAYAQVPWLESHDHTRSAGWQPVRPS